ncbi:hypothetical protein [Microbacterium sp.]|uniref:hypothetical protein n=1 Tax=Microbacterium sp. TaxID=51671 RepID=UPI0028111280|nr:hypothetical protein [Microbacterium sp.]
MPRPRLILRSAVVVAVAASLAVLGGTAAHAKGGDVGGAGSTYYLNDEWSGQANHVVEYGLRTDRAYSGDWDGDGKDSLAVRRGNRYYLTNSTTGKVAITFAYGRTNDVTLVGDWNGDGVDTLAVRRGNMYYFTNKLKGGDAETVLAYGRAGDQVLVGDWNGDGKDTLAVRRANTFYFADSLTGGDASRVLAYGRAADLVYVGDWNGDGTDTPAVRRGATYYVTDRFAPGNADRTLTYGRANDSTLVGDWNGDRKDSLGVRRSNPAEVSAAIRWATTEYGTFQSGTYSGTGNRTITLPAGAKGGLLVASHRGSGEFRLELRKAGATIDIPVYVTGTYAGTTAFGLDRAQQGGTLSVVASGAWTVRVLPMESASVLPTSGTGDGVFLYGAGARNVSSTHSGASQLVAVQWSGSDASRSRVVIEANGSGRLAAGPSVVYVVADGKWTLTPR